MFSFKHLLIIIIVVESLWIFCHDIMEIVYELRAHENFERGVQAVMMHHIYFGDYGSWRYRSNVFHSHNDPQDSIDVCKYR
jgi:hypothetical protein